jgi:hypothetical protein
VPTHAPDGRANLDVQLAAGLFERAGRELSVHEVACYALAALSAPAYQGAYDAWLRMDYPRLPLPTDAAAFEARLAAGRELRALWCDPLTVPGSTVSPTEPDGAGDVAAADAEALVVGHHRVVQRWMQGQRRTPAASLLLRARAARLAKHIRELT